MTDIKYWVGLSRISSVGPVRTRLLEAHFGTLERAWAASMSDLRAAGVDTNTARSIITQRPSISLDDEMEKLDRAGTRALKRQGAAPSQYSAADWT